MRRKENGVAVRRGVGVVMAQYLDQDGNSDTFVAAVKVAIGAEVGAAFDGIARILLEDIPFFTKNDARDEAFFFAPEQRGTQCCAQRTSLPCGSVTMNDFDGDDSRLPGLAQFGEKTLTRFLYGGHTYFYVEDPKGGHRSSRMALCLKIAIAESDCV
jgi:hypothetical protein